MNPAARRIAADPDHCPTCGHAISGDTGVRVELESNLAVINGAVVYLQPKHAEILSVLVDRMPRTASTDHIWRSVYGLIEEPESENALRVHICKLRSAVASSGLFIENIPSKGYRARLQ